MQHWLRGVLLFAFLAAALAGPTLAQDLRIIPVPPHVRPQWTPLPGNPQVYYAPNLPTDVFRFRGRYYFFWEGYWYQSRSARGPWKSAAQVPPAVAVIDPATFKKKQQPPALSSPPPLPAPGVSGLPPEPAAPPEPPQGSAPPASPPVTPAEAPPSPKMM
jgi:hypothetical protein